MKLAKDADAAKNANLDRSFTLEVVRVTERAAVASAMWRGKGDEKSADRAAVEAMRTEFDRVPVRGRVVIGEGERDEAPMLYIGEEVGGGTGPAVDIAVDPLEGTTLCAKNQQDALCVLAVAERGGLLHAPDIYMEKIAIAPGYPAGLIDVEASATDNIKALAGAKGVPVGEIVSCVLDRPRHARLIEELRTLGIGVKLIGDGDVAGVIHAANVRDTGIDIYLGSGGAPEGVLAAAAMRCLGGQMQGKLIFDTEDKKERGRKTGISDFNRVYDVRDLASGDVLFAATGVTDGGLVDGVRIAPSHIDTETVVMRSWSGTIRWVKARHRRAPGGAI